ncbi:SLATT domain-containing protein [Oxalobacteraceae sp. CFBP 8755]|nr:SLATT domain-containing protein [Oxalobacteraceae sp. CFBP 8755]
MITSLTKVRTDVWRTSSARYNAARRLRRRELFATVSLALLSSLTVAIAFIQRIYAPPSSQADNYLTALSGFLGVFLLTISLVEWGAKTGATAEALHQNAEKLNDLQRKIGLKTGLLSSGGTMTWNEVDALADEYKLLKAECRFNHEPIDDAYFKAHHRNAPEFLINGNPAMSERQAFWYATRWKISSIWYFTGLWFIVLGLALPLKSTEWWENPNTNSAQAEATSATVISPTSPLK